jgi:hypothetical protein
VTAAGRIASSSSVPIGGSNESVVGVVVMIPCGRKTRRGMECRYRIKCPHQSHEDYVSRDDVVFVVVLG